MKIDEGLLKGLVSHILNAERSLVLGPDKKPTGEVYRGLIDSATKRQVSPVFTEMLRIKKHPLADVEDETCKPYKEDEGEACGKCRRDVLHAYTEEAMKRGLIMFRPIKGQLVPDPKRPGKFTQKKGFVIYYKPGEGTQTVDYRAAAEKALAM